MTHETVAHPDCCILFINERKELEFMSCKSREAVSLVGIATGCGLDSQDLIPDRGKRFFSTPKCPDQLWGPPSLLISGYQELFPGGWGVKQSGHEADHSLPSSAEVKNGGALPPLPHMSSWRGA
jgi:hypothetical protein